ncbi:MAG: YggN family protein [Pseudomonadota bacterium]|nr:YggN family protein [Pseudomonadota bacterium]
MLRATGAALMLCGATLAQAADIHIDSHCDYELDHEITLSGDHVRIEADGRTWDFIDGGITRNGKALSLSDAQRTLATEYHDGMQAVVPAITDLALRAAQLGIEAVALVTAGLSGDDSMIDRVIERSEALILRLHQEFDGRRLPAGRALRSQAIDDDLTALAADMAGNMVSSVASFVGQAIFNPEAVEARAEYLERIVEYRIERRAAPLESDAEKVCKQLRELDEVETRLDLFDVIRGEKVV